MDSINDIVNQSDVIPIDGADAVNDYSETYGRHVIRDQYPDIINGLKRGNQRELYTIRNYNPDKGKNSAAAVGEVMDLHIAGDLSMYNAIARMAQPFNYNPPLVRFHGSAGKYHKPMAGAMRYTGVSLGLFSQALFFNGINEDSIPMRFANDTSSREPISLIPAIPTNLLFGVHGIAYARSSKIPPRNLNDICDLTIAYCHHRAKHGVLTPFKLDKHIEKLIPDFPIKNRIINWEKLLKEYRDGHFTANIKITGDVIISQDKVDVLTLPYGISFVDPKVKEITKIEHLMRQEIFNNTPISKAIDGEALLTADKTTSDHESKVTIKFKRTVNPFEVWEQIARKIEFYGSYKPIFLYTDPEGYATRMTPVTLLDAWFEARYNLVMGSKRQSIQNVSRDINITKAYIVVCDNRDAVIDVIKTYRSEPAIEQLTQQFDLSISQAEYLYNTGGIKLIGPESKEELYRRLDALTERLEKLKQSLSNIPNEMADVAESIKKKFGRQRITKLPKYIGYVWIENYNGCIQFESTDEIPEILNRFNKCAVEIHFYDLSGKKPTLYHVLPNGKLSNESYINQVTMGDIYGLNHTGDLYTVNINPDTTACCVKGFVPGKRTDGYFYTAENSIIINKDGTYARVKTPEVISVRKTICRGAFTDIIYIYPDTDQPHFLISMNDELQNTITIHRFDPTKKFGKLIFPPIGNKKILHHYTGIDWYFGIPSKFLNRMNTKAFHILDANALLGNNDTLKLELNTQKLKRNPYFKIL